MKTKHLINLITTVSTNSDIIAVLRRTLNPTEFDNLTNQLTNDFHIELMELDDDTTEVVWTDDENGVIDEVSMPEFKAIIIDLLL